MSLPHNVQVTQNLTETIETTIAELTRQISDIRVVALEDLGAGLAIINASVNDNGAKIDNLAMALSRSVCAFV
jgi:hypothetical protein